MSILTACFLFAGSLCGSFCDVKSLDLHACCHHKKAPAQADSNCGHTAAKVELSQPPVDLGEGPVLPVVSIRSVYAETVSAPSPPPLPPTPINALRI